MQLMAIYTTMFGGDSILRNKHLVVYSLVGVREFSTNMFRAGFEHMKQFAKENGCTKIVSATVGESVEKVWKQMGASVSKILELEV